MKIIDDIKDCTGCSVCANVCPVDCIRMVPNEEGFLYPQIDAKSCVECGMCRKGCPLNNIVTEKKDGCPHAYLGRSVDNGVCEQGASGGLFTSIAIEFIKHFSGVVYGAAYDVEFKVNHRRVENVEDVPALSKSKYVQSAIGGIYRDVKKDLDVGRYVLFSGTPCQIYGLKAFLKKKYGNLYCIDVVCHGVPSPLVYEKYLEWQRSKYGDIQEVVFRDKELHASFYRGGMGILFKNGYKYFKYSELDAYGTFFWGHYSIRESCFQCKYKSIWRVSDLTVGDCWFSNELIGKKDDLGMTLVLVQSQRGMGLLELAKGNISISKIDSVSAIKSNGGMIYESCQRNPLRKYFFDDLINNGFGYVVKKYMKKPSLKHLVVTRLKNLGVIPPMVVAAKRKAELDKRLNRDIPEHSKCLVFLRGRR